MKMNGDERRQMTVLIAEDEEGLQLLATLTIRAMGLKVLAASNAEEALHHWKLHRDEIELLFTDVVMPGEFSGFDLAEKLRADRPALPTIVSSGYDGAQNQNSAVLQQGVTYLPKPYRQGDLSALIATMLANAIPKHHCHAA